MAHAKIKTGSDIVNGLSVVCTGRKTSLFDNTQRNPHYTATTQVPAVTVLETRFKYHGGTGGSGNWEH